MKLLNFIKKKIKNKFNLIYLIIGIGNTIAGYFIGVITFLFLYDLFGVIGVSIVSNIISISISYLNFKFFLFKTNGNILVEYFKSFLNYGLSFIVSTIFLWFLIEKFEINIFFSQLIIMPIIIIINYFGNRFFVFKN